MLTLVAFPLALLFVAVLLVMLFSILSKRPHPNDRLSHPEGLPPDPRRTAFDGDEAKLQRLIARERRLHPLAPKTQVELRAYARMRRIRGDN